MEIHEEIREALSSQGDEGVAFEQIQDEGDSPLNQPVVPPKSGEQKSETTEEQPDPDEQEPDQETGQEYDDTSDDASEQEIDQDYDQGAAKEEEIELEIPTSHAAQAADTLIGVTNNALETGGSYFVKIRKHGEFYEFDEVIEVIDKQNKKNVKRIKLDKEDKALLRPILITLAKKRGKVMSPEWQLAAAVFTILLKKVKAMFEIRAENAILEDRILDIIREEKGYMGEDYDEDDEQEQEKEQEQEYHTQEKPLETTRIVPTPIEELEGLVDVAEEDTPEETTEKE